MLLDPRMTFRTHQLDAMVKNPVLLLEMGVQPNDLPEDLLRIPERTLGTPVSTPAKTP
jgi:hypothetical protein